MTAELALSAAFLGFSFLYFSENPRLLLFLAIALTPVISLLWSFKVFRFSLVDIAFGWILIILSAALLKRYLSGALNRGKFFVPYVVFYAYTTLSLALNFDRRFLWDYLQVVFQLSVGLIAYLSVLNFFGPEDRWNLLKSVRVAVIITLSLVAFQLLTGIGTEHSRFSYLTGLYRNEGFLTRMAIVGIIINLPIRSNRLWERNRILSTILLYGSFLTLGLAISRNAVLAAFAIVLVFTFIEKRYVWLIATLLFGIAIYLMVGVVHTGYEAKLKKEITYLQGGEIRIETLGSGRVGRWTRTWNGFMEAGVRDKMIGIGRGIGPHGQFLDTLKRSGIIGVCVTLYLYLGITVFTVKIFRRNAKDPFAWFGALLLIAYWALFVASSPLFETTVQLLIFTFIAILERKPMSGPYPAKPSRSMAGARS